MLTMMQQEVKSRKAFTVTWTNAMRMNIVYKPI